MHIGWFEGTPCMNTSVIDPPPGEFETPEQEARYTAWLQGEIAARLANPGRLIPHDEVERRMTERLAHLRRHKAA